MSDDRHLKEIEASLRDIRQLHPRFVANIEPKSGSWLGCPRCDVGWDN